MSGAAATRPRPAPRGPRPSSRCWAPRPCAHAAARAALRRARDRARGARGLHDRAVGADHDRARAAHLRRRDARRGWSSCSASPSAGATTTPASSGRRSTCWCRPSPARPTFRIPLRVQLRPRAGGDQVPVLAARRRGAADVQLHRHDLLPRGDGRMQMRRCRGTCRRASSCRSSTWRRDDRHHYPTAAGCALSTETLDALRRAQGASSGCPRSTPRSRRCWRRGGVSGTLEELVESLLYEGYALYPYTPARPRTRRRRRSGSSTRPPTRSTPAPTTTCGSSARWRPRASRRRRAPRCASCRPAASATRAWSGAIELPGPARRRAFAFDGLAAARGCGWIRTASGCRACACACTTPPRSTAPGMRPRRGAAAPAALHPRRAARARAGASSRRWTTPELREREHLPGAGQPGRRHGARRGDHAARPPAARAREPRQPVRRHRDRGGAAAARARALSDGEREEIADQDPAVREMVERAAATTPQDLFACTG